MELNELLHEDVIKRLNRFGFTEFTEFSTTSRGYESIFNNKRFYVYYDGAKMLMSIENLNPEKSKSGNSHLKKVSELNIFSGNLRDTLDSIYFIDDKKDCRWALSEEEYNKDPNPDKCHKITLEQALCVPFIDIVRNEKLDQLI